MARLRYNNLVGTLGASLTNSGTSITFSAALTYNNGTSVPTLSGSDYIPLSITDTFEVVHLTAYTSGATTGTISRGQDGTSGVAHNNLANFECAPNTTDFTTIVESQISLSDVTTDDVSTSAHGFAPKAPNDTTKFLRGDATWAVPSSGSTSLVVFSPPTGSTSAWGDGVSGSGAVAHGEAYIATDTGSTATSQANSYAGSQHTLSFNHSQTLGCFGFLISPEGTDFDAWYGVGTFGGGPTFAGSAITNYQKNQFGVKWNRVGSGTVAFSATNGNGTTETATSIGTSTSGELLAIDVVPATSIKTYVNGALVATSTTNLPSGQGGSLQGPWLGASNRGVASDTKLILDTLSWAIVGH